MSGIDRTEILRRDCRNCGGGGYVMVNGAEELCRTCGGSGMEEKVVPYKFDGERTSEELDQIWNQ